MGKVEKKKDLGTQGEAIAASYLARKGFQILEMNYTYDRKEIDIIALDKKKLVFVEVKSRVPKIMESHDAAISMGKIRNIVHAAEGYILSHDYEEEVRFDVVFVLFANKDIEIEHIEDAFISPVQ